MPETLCQQRFTSNLRALLLTISFSISRCHSGVQKSNPRLEWLRVLIAGHRIYPVPPGPIRASNVPSGCLLSCEGHLDPAERSPAWPSSLGAVYRPQHPGSSPEAALLMWPVVTSVCKPAPCSPGWSSHIPSLGATTNLWNQLKYLPVDPILTQRFSEKASPSQLRPKKIMLWKVKAGSEEPEKRESGYKHHYCRTREKVCWSRMEMVDGHGW